MQWMKIFLRGRIQESKTKNVQEKKMMRSFHIYSWKKNVSRDFNQNW